MDYYESAEGITITKRRAIAEYVAHGLSEVELFDDLGDHDEYDAQRVLAMLGW